MGALDSEWVARYARGPSASTTKRAMSLHKNVRELLGEGEYETILQGSYKNDTALADMNDVDILAIRSDVAKADFGWSKKIAWVGIFDDIEKRIQADQRYADKWTRKDKCVTLDTGINIDIVPAVYLKDAMKDPILIYSFRNKAERKNWPRAHYDNATSKNQRTGGAFKSTVRLFKRWARAHFPDEKVVSSYYMESLLYSLEDSHFSGDLAADFFQVATAIIERHGGWSGHSFTKLPRIAGDGDLFSDVEWGSGAFLKFLEQLRVAIPYATEALMHDGPDRAKAAWRMVFAGHDR